MGWGGVCGVCVVVVVVVVVVCGGGVHAGAHRFDSLIP